MLSNLAKYYFTLVVFAMGFNTYAQKDSTFQRYLDSNISTKSLQNNDLIFIKEVLTNQRILLQSTFNKREKEKSFEEVFSQTSILEKSIIHYVKMDHKVIVNEMDMQNTNVDSELLLARLVYIKSKTWCMEERLQKRVEELYKDSKSSNVVDKNIIEIMTLTENVISSLEKAKRLDRMKHKYNQKIVIANWESTANRLKENNKKLDKFDVQFQKQYRLMLVDLYTMTSVLSMF